MSFLFKKVAATDAAEFRIVHAKGVGKWWVEPNVSMFGGEWGNGRKEFATREEAEKYAKGTGKTYIVRDECEGEDAAEFKVGDKIWVDPSYGANLNIGYGWNVGIVKRVSIGNIDVDFKGQVISVPAPYCARVNSSGKPVFDSAAQDDITPKFKIGETVKGSRGGVYPTENDIGKVVEFHPDSKTYSVMSNKYGRKIDYHENELRKANDTAAQDRGDYATNTSALLRTALGNLRTAYSVVNRAISNIEDAMSKVQDAQAKSSLKSMLQEWLECEREIWATIDKVDRIPVPSGIGVPHKAKLSPEDRKFIEEFFGR